MKKTLLFLFAVSCFFACSVEPVDPYLEEGLNQELKMTADNNDCVTVHRFGDAGTITVTNDGEDLLVTIAASGDFSLTGVRLQVSKNYNDFPTVGRGNLPPGKMDIHKKFESGVQDYTWRFPLSDYGNSVVIASFSEFTSADDSITAWAGDEKVKFGNWAYFEYEDLNCTPTCDTPDMDGEILLDYSYIESLGLEAADLLEALVNEGILTGGTFEPGLESLLEEILKSGGGESQSLSTTYTVGEGNCTASVDVSIAVAACEAVDAGNDNSVTMTWKQVDDIPDNEAVEEFFLGLLDEEVDRENGTFDPTIQEVIDTFQEYSYNTVGALTTNYILGAGDCQDSAELTVNFFSCTINAGDDNSATMTWQEVDDLEDNDAVEEAFLNLLDEDVSREGTFDPSIQEIINDFQAYPANGEGALTTTYTVGTGECVDSAELTLNVFSEPCTIDAGNDNSVTMTWQQVDDIPDNDAVEEAFLNLLDEDVSREGTFDPSIQDVIDRFQDSDYNSSGSLVTIYTVGEGECTDSVTLTINYESDPFVN